MFSLFDLLEPSVPQIRILDIGAARVSEHEVYGPVLNRGAGRVVGFEPDPEQCSALNAQFGPSNRYLPYVIFDGRPRRFFITRSAASSSLYEPDQDLRTKFSELAEAGEVIRVEEMPTRRLDEIEELADGADFIKVDAQGAEYEIFRNGERIARGACVIHTEAHLLPLYKGQPLWSDQDQILREYGYQFHRFYSVLGRPIKPLFNRNNPSQPISQLTQVDVVYVKRFDEIERMPEEQILKTAIILHDCYQSLDLCHWVLSVYDRMTGSELAGRYLRSLTQGNVGIG